MSGEKSFGSGDPRHRVRAVNPRAAPGLILALHAAVLENAGALIGCAFGYVVGRRGRRNVKEDIYDR